MKRIISIFVTSCFITSLFVSTVFAVKQSLSVVIHSTPLASNGYSDFAGGVLNTSVGAMVDFTAVVESAGVVNTAPSWYFDEAYLACSELTEFVPPALRCKIIAEGKTGVYLNFEALMVDASTWQRTSNTIRLEINGQLPEKTSYSDYTILELSSSDGYKNYASPFPDLSLTNLLGKAAVELWRRDIISGYPDGKFEAKNNVNRAEAAKFLVNSKYGGALSTSVGKNFPDVPSAAWYSAYVMTAYDDGILSGYPDGTFDPGKTINTAEFMKMITLTFHLGLNLPHNYSDVPHDAWFAAYAGAAKVYNLFPLRSSSYLDPARVMTREEVAIAIYQYFVYSYKAMITQ